MTTPTLPDAIGRGRSARSVPIMGRFHASQLVGTALYVFAAAMAISSRSQAFPIALISLATRKTAKRCARQEMLSFIITTSMMKRAKTWLP
ncbi:hypothetical protein GCM10010136_03980 [Limoniibacter endophyticus]|uniref:Uncharacterized protein n=1 Tax=Limoniibacter endophyticus TaxID=1565040 RepID=A0A8J3DE90_9HYPH|nr:hypothetical protein GCM10010136_03980 [Limoniibacter endophyticus]